MDGPAGLGAKKTESACCLDPAGVLGREKREPGKREPGLEGHGLQMRRGVCVCVCMHCMSVHICVRVCAEHVYVAGSRQ